MKKPAQRGRRRASEFLDLSGRLLQAITVRRHGGSMMMVMTEMAVALHLIQTIRQKGALCQPLHLLLVVQFPVCRLHRCKMIQSPERAD
jgi:hypothetical protein